MNNPNNPIVPKNPNNLASLLSGPLDEISVPAGGSWLPELRYAWPISQIVDPENTDKKGRPIVANNRFFLGTPDAPVFLGEGDMIVPVNQRATLQIVESTPTATLRYAVGYRGGNRKGADYQEALKLIERYPDARNAKKGREPRIREEKGEPVALAVNEGASYLVAVVRRGAGTFAEMPAFRSLFRFIAGAFAASGLRQRMGFRLKADDLSAALEEFEGRTYPSRKKLPQALDLVSLDDATLALIASAFEAQAEEIEEWRTR